MELPTGEIGRRYMLRAADHGRPLITATSSFDPPIPGEIAALTQSTVIPDRLLDLLESIPTSYLAVHNALLSPERRLAVESLLSKGIRTGRLRFIRSFDDILRNGLRARNDLYAVVKVEPSSRTEASEPPPASYAEYAPLWQNLPLDFRDSAYFTYRLYKVAYGRQPHLSEFLSDLQMVRQDAPFGSVDTLSIAEQASLAERW